MSLYSNDWGSFISEFPRGGSRKEVGRPRKRPSIRVLGWWSGLRYPSKVKYIPLYPSLKTGSLRLRIRLSHL